MAESDDYDLKPQEPRSGAQVSAVPTDTDSAATPSTPPPADIAAAKQAKEAEAENEADIKKNKGMALLAYLSVLVVIPMVFGQHSKFVRHHLNQGLLLFVLEAVTWVGCKIIMLLGYPILHLSGAVYLTSLVGGLLWLLFAVISLLGLLHVAGGSWANLPIVGQYEIISLQGSDD